MADENNPAAPAAQPANPAQAADQRSDEQRAADKKPDDKTGKATTTPATAATVATAQAAGEKIVVIRPTCDHDAHIGGTRYSLKKGVQQKVPFSVACVFQNAAVAVIVN
jgi:hypothetical protein